MPRCRPSHRIPNFNTPVWLWALGTNPGANPHATAANGQLVVPAPGPLFSGPPAPGFELLPYLYLPRGTKAEFPQGPFGQAWAQIDPPLGRAYRIVQVEDVARNFPNEFRVLLITYDLAQPWDLVQTSPGYWQYLNRTRPTT